MTDPTGYPLLSYGRMISCEPRMSAYADALKAAIKPGCSVIDIGAGSGIFSLLACKYGAGAVTAIEPNDAVELLRFAGAANGFDGRITVFQGISTDYNGPPADVIISDLRGHLPLFERHIPTIIDARERLLAPGGRLIPARDRLFGALVHDPEFYKSYSDPWISNSLDIDLSDGHRFAVNQWQKASFTPIDLMSSPQPLLEIDYRTICNPNIEIDFSLATEAPGEAHGILIWFDAELATGIGFSNAPGEPEQVYGQTFFPFERPISLLVGDRIDIILRANLVAGSYVWSWNSKVLRANAQTAEGKFRQSTFRSRPLSRSKLIRGAPTFVPQPSESLAIEKMCLSMIDGQTSLSEIAESLLVAFPNHFAKQSVALDHVIEVAGRHDDSDS